MAHESNLKLLHPGINNILSTWPKHYTGEQRHYWATENIRKQFFDFWGTSQFISGERGNRYHSPPPPLLGGLQYLWTYSATNKDLTQYGP